VINTTHVSRKDAKAPGKIIIATEGTEKVQINPVKSCMNDWYYHESAAIWPVRLLKNIQLQNIGKDNKTRSLMNFWLNPVSAPGGA
jgi:hypothetical protein